MLIRDQKPTLSSPFSPRRLRASSGVATSHPGCSQSEAPPAPVRHCWSRAAPCRPTAPVGGSLLILQLPRSSAGSGSERDFPFLIRHEPPHRKPHSGPNSAPSMAPWRHMRGDEVVAAPPKVPVEQQRAAVQCLPRDEQDATEQIQMIREYRSRGLRAPATKSRSASACQGQTRLRGSHSAFAEPSGSWRFQLEERNLHGAGDGGHPPVVAGERDRLTVIDQVRA